MPSASVPACTKPTSRPALSTSAAVEPASVVLSLARIGLTCNRLLTMKCKMLWYMRGINHAKTDKLPEDRPQYQ